MKVSKVILVSLLGIFPFSGGTILKKQPAVKVVKISPAAAKELLKSDPSVLLVDVRSAEEHREMRIRGSILIPNTSIEQLAPKKLPDKEAKIIVYCRSGARAAGAEAALIRMGYTNVYDLGGIMSWPYETISG